MPSFRGLLAYSLALAALAASARSKPEEFDWDKVEPTTDLRYHDCFDGFQCARLLVPLDWLDVDNNKTIAIAITKLPAKVAEDDPSFGGTILGNPGGPGGSGVSFIRRFGRTLQAVVDRDKKWELLSWDPRGVGATTPRVDCFGTVLARDRYIVEKHGIGAVTSAEDVLKRHFAVADAWSSLCQTADQDIDVLPYLTTPSVARDMVEMIDRIEDLRTAELAKKAASNEAQQIPITAERTASGPVRLNYMGFSYGTVLGNYFASMFPGRVGRILVDGVDDSYDYASAKWLCNLKDTEKVVDFFYETCFEAGERCPIWSEDDQGPADIKTRIDKFISDADARPIPYIDGLDVFALTGDDLRLSFRRALYSPTDGFEPHAQTLAEALKGNFTGVVSSIAVPRLQDACSVDDAVFEQGTDTTAAIACSDAEDQSDHLYDSAFFADYVAELHNQSRTFGALWATIRLSCAAWRSRGKWRFSGPFETPPADPSLREGVPAAPLLFVSNRLDTVTPLANAFLMAEGHPGSAVVIQESVGHCALAGDWSPCLNEIVSDYFEFGVVPETGTSCEIDPGCRPWAEGPCGPNFTTLGYKDDSLYSPRSHFRPLEI